MDLRLAGRLCWSSVLVAVALLGACVPAGSAAPTWQRAVDLSAPEETADVSIVAMNLAGDAVVLWVVDGTHVKVAVRRAGAAFSAPIRVSREVDGKIINYPTVAIDEAGNAITAWQLTDDYGDATTVVQAAVISPDGSVSGPIRLSGRGDAFGAAVAMAGTGDAIVTWTADTTSGNVVQAVTRPRGGRFSMPVNLSANGADVIFSDVAMNAAGDAIVAWPRGPSGAHVVQAALHPAGGGFAEPVNLSAPGRDALAPRVAIDPAGNALVTWNRFNGTKLGVQAAARPARGAFSMPADLSPPFRDGLLATPALDATGNALVLWLYEDVFADVSHGVVQVSGRPAGGSFSAPVDLSGAGYDADYPNLATSPSGAAIATWTRATNDDVLSIAGVRAAHRAPGGSFSAPIDLAPARQRVSVPNAAMDQAGNAIAVWTRIAHSDGGTVQAAVYQESALPPPPAPPRIAGLRLSPTAFRSALSGSPVAAPGARGGTRVTYALSVAARVRFTVQRRTAGRLVAGRCAATSSANRRRTRCTRFVRVPGSFVRVRPAGGDEFTFTGRLARRRLGVGRYRLNVVPTAAGRAGTPARAGFRIAR